MDIRTEGVQAVLGGSAILKGVDIQVGQRELVGIIGPNGSGKSTLLKCIYRVLKPTGGAVLLDGRDLDQYSYRESARRIAVVAQHNYYNFEFSVQDVVMMGRAPHKRALDRDNADDFRLVAEALELIARVSPREAYLTHMSHDIGLHAETEPTLPPHVHMAYDTLEIEIND